MLNKKHLNKIQLKSSIRYKKKNKFILKIKDNLYENLQNKLIDNEMLHTWFVWIFLKTPEIWMLILMYYSIFKN